MDLKKQYGTDRQKEVDGIWEDFSDGIRVKVARFNNPKYRDLSTSEITKNPRKYRGKKPNDKIMKDLQIKCAAYHVLINWEGVDWNGQTNIPYTPELGIEIFNELPDFYDEIIGIAGNIENYRLENLEEDKEK